MSRLHCMYTYNCHFFLFRTHLFVLAPLPETLGGVGTIRPLGSRRRRFGRDPCSVSRVASLLNVFGLGHGYGKSPGFRNISGDGASASPRGVGFRIPPGIGCTHHFDANPKNTNNARVPDPEVNIRSDFCPLMNTVMTTANTHNLKKLPPSSTSRQHRACVAHPSAPFCCG